MKVWKVYRDNFYKGAFSVEGRARAYAAFINANYGRYSAGVQEEDLPNFNKKVLDEKWREYEKNGYWTY
jgi:hypothetical protein